MHRIRDLAAHRIQNRQFQCRALRNLVVAGGTFISNNTSAGVTPGPSQGQYTFCSYRLEVLTCALRYEWISPLVLYRATMDAVVFGGGSLNLRTEIRLDQAAGVVSRNHGRGSFRRCTPLESAAVMCPTVALYQGDEAEQNGKYSVASIQASVSELDSANLIPLKQFLDYESNHLDALEAYI
ncbi:hypothetical protein C8R45DRAFT_935874 [Mycena sanguinolenta]|nr:hypothetical protein C8R45DRAFT_935874 [Mycena sanguinolenta]